MISNSSNVDDANQRGDRDDYKDLYKATKSLGKINFFSSNKRNHSNANNNFEKVLNEISNIASLGRQSYRNNEKPSLQALAL